MDLITTHSILFPGRILCQVDYLVKIKIVFICLKPAKLTNDNQGFKNGFLKQIKNRSTMESWNKIN